MPTDQDDATLKERARCLRIVEVHQPNVAGDRMAETVLLRIANLIRNGIDDPRPIGPIMDEHERPFSP